MADLNLKLVISGSNDGAIAALNQVIERSRATGTAMSRTDAAGTFGKTRVGLESISAQLARLQGLAAGFASGTFLLSLASDAVRVADEMKGVEARVRLASSSFAEFNQNLAAIRTTAQATGTQTANVAALFNRIATPIRDMGGSAADAQAAVVMVGNALRISGAGAAESSSAMLQFAQAMGSGVLRGEELSSILENAPRLAQALAAGLGVTVGELRNLGEQGALTSQQVFKALQSQQSALAAEAGRLPQTVGMAWTNLGEGTKQYIGQLDKATGASASLASALNTVAQNIPAIASGLGDVAILAAVAFGGRMVASIAAVSSGVGVLTTALGAASLAGRGLLALFGGPFGLVVAAITGGAMVWEHFASKGKEATVDTGVSLKELTARFKDFSGKAGPQEAAAALAELKDKAAEARDQLASPLFRSSKEGIALAADLKVAESAIDDLEARAQKFKDSHTKERGLLGLDKLKLDVGGLVSDDTQKQMNAWSVLYKDFIGNAIGDNNKLKANALEVKAALATLLAAAKTPAEFTGLISRMGEALKASPKDATLKSQLESAIEGRMQAEMKALNGLVAGLEARAQRTQSLFASSANIALGQFSQAAALAKVAAELKNDVGTGARIDINSRNAEIVVAQQSANLQVAALEQVSGRKRELIQQGLKDAQGATRDEIEAVQRSSREKIAQWEGEVAKGTKSKEQLADAETKLAKETADKVTAARAVSKQAEIDAIRQTREVDAEAARQRVTIAEVLYKTLQSKSQDALAQYKQYAQQVIALDQKIANNRLDTASAINTLQRSDMSPGDQLKSLRDELASVKAEANKALRGGDKDAALELLNRQKSLAQQIGQQSGEGIDKKEQIKEGSAELKRIGAEADAILQEQRATAQAVAAQQLANYQQMTHAMNALAQQITALNEKAAIKLKPEIDSAALDGAIAAVKQAFAGVTIPIKVQATGLPSGSPGPVVEEVKTSRAYGGPLPGNAPHDRADNMMYWGTPGEWVIQRPAVRHYGSAFIAAVNAMALPKFAFGGQLGSNSAIGRLAIPSLPASRGEPARVGATFDLGRLGRVPVQMAAKDHDELARRFALESLKFGGRR